MRALRIVKKRHALTAFSGDGARAYGGRWNFPGVPMVYAAQSRALAALESLAHFGGAERRMQFVTYEIEIPDRLAQHVFFRKRG
jgi:RES domain-containing protein